MRGTEHSRCELAYLGEYALTPSRSGRSMPLMPTFRSFFALGLVALASSTVACSSTDSSSPDDSDGIVVDTPSAGQALITGTKQPFRWHGGDGKGTVSISLVPKSGSAITIAEGLPNTGEAEVDLHLLDSAARKGGTIRIAPSGAEATAAYRVGSKPAARTAGAGAVMVGSLAAFSWNGAAEEYAWLDVHTGDKVTIGTVGDLETWTSNTLAVDYEQGLLYVLGFHGMTQKIYTLDTATGALVNDVGVMGSSLAYVGLNVIADHSIIAYSWNDAMMKEEMTRIDPTTGATEVIGTVGDLMWWSNEAVYAPGSNTAYVLGAPDMAPGQNIYSLDATTGQLIGQHALSLSQISGLVVNSAGEVLGFRWNGSTEDMVRIDPSTGLVTVIGQVGDLEMWSNSAAINRTTDVVHVLGKNAADASKLYSLDAHTGALLYDSSVAEYPTDAILVY